ncbi:MAG: hypothetical protein QXS02_00505 [Candidatus Thermoplasmatota archaeon]
MINIKKFNAWTVFSMIFMIAGLIFYISWGIRYNVWYDIGIYSVTILLVMGGICGVILSLYEKKEELNK